MGKAALVFGALFVLIGIGIVYLSVSSYNQASASAGWPNVTGTISSSNISSGYGCLTQDSKYCGTLYTPIVFYNYSVSGVQYPGNYLLQSYADSGTASEQLEDYYQAGSPVTVYYDPATPSLSVLYLSTGASVDGFIGVGTGIAFLLAGAVIIIKRGIVQK